jgi:ribosome-binding protein aMBF1 (putative translation factor)
MIRNEQEYREAVERLNAEKQRLGEHRARLAESGLNEEELKRVMDPMLSFHEQLKEEVTHYERLKRGDFQKLENLEGIGQLLVSLRIAQGISQRELARRLDVHESQISRDERNEYHGVTLDRAIRILKALGVRLETKVVAAPLGREESEASSC